MKKIKSTAKAFYKALELPVFTVLYFGYLLYWLYVQSRPLNVKGIMDSFNHKTGKGVLPSITILAWVILILFIKDHPVVIKIIVFVAFLITIAFLLVPELLTASKMAYNLSVEGIKEAMKGYASLMPGEEPRPNPYIEGSVEHAGYDAAIKQLLEKWPKHRQREIGEKAIDDLMNHNENRNPYTDMEFEYYVYNFAYEYFKNKRENQTAGPDQN